MKTTTQPTPHQPSGRRNKINNNKPQQQHIAQQTPTASASQKLLQTSNCLYFSYVEMNVVR